MKKKLVSILLSGGLLVGGMGYSVSAASDSNNGIVDQLTELQTKVSNLANEVINLLPLKDDVKSVNDELRIANTALAEQKIQIDSLKKEIEALKSSSSGSVETITPEVKAKFQEVITKNSNYFINYYTAEFNEYGEPTKYILTKINAVNYDMKEIDGKAVLRIYTEGNYNWTFVPAGTNGNPDEVDGSGLYFARNFVSRCDPIFKAFGVNFHYEFYQNGERVTPYLTSIQ